MPAPQPRRPGAPSAPARPGAPARPAASGRAAPARPSAPSGRAPASKTAASASRRAPAPARNDDAEFGDDEEEEQYAAPKKKKGGGGMMWVIAIIVTLVLVGLGVAVLMFGGDIIASDSEKEQTNVAAWVKIQENAAFEDDTVKASPLYKAGLLTDEMKSVIKAGHAAQVDTKMKRPAQPQTMDQLINKYSALSEIIKNHAEVGALQDAFKSVNERMGDRKNVDTRIAGLIDLYELMGKLLLLKKQVVQVAPKDLPYVKKDLIGEKDQQGQVDKWSKDLRRHLEPKNSLYTEAKDEILRHKESAIYQRFKVGSAIFGMLNNDEAIENYKTQDPEIYAVLKEHYQKFEDDFRERWEGASATFGTHVMSKAQEEFDTLQKEMADKGEAYNKMIENFVTKREPYIDALAKLAESAGIQNRKEVQERLQALRKTVRDWKDQKIRNVQ